MTSGQDDTTLRCPTCGGKDIRRSQRHGIFDAVMQAVHRLPHRCRGCRRRFFVHSTRAVPDHATREAEANEPARNARTS